MLDDKRDAAVRRVLCLLLTAQLLFAYGLTCRCERASSCVADRSHWHGPATDPAESSGDAFYLPEWTAVGGRVKRLCESEMTWLAVPTAFVVASSSSVNPPYAPLASPDATLIPCPIYLRARALLI